MLELDRFGDLARLEAFHADADPHRRAVYERPHGLQVGKESTRRYAGYLLADAAFLLREASADDRPAGNGFLTADRAYF